MYGKFQEHLQKELTDILYSFLYNIPTADFLLFPRNRSSRPSEDSGVALLQRKLVKSSCET